MQLSLFDYKLPPELIAQVPARKRDESRLMVLDRARGVTCIKPFKSVVDYLAKGDALVINTTKVFKARLIGKRESGAEVEIFLIRPLDTSRQKGQRGKSVVHEKRNPPRGVGHPREKRQEHRAPALQGSRSRFYRALGRPMKRLKEGERIYFDSDYLTLVKKHDEGYCDVEFQSASMQKRVIGHYGHVPLPQYIKRDDSPTDIRRYQTVYAESDKVGAVAAPTAGFHFTKPILDALQKKGVKIIKLCLHVGPGTFKPVTAEKIEDHTVDPEFAELSQKSANALNKIRAAGGKVFAVGTTSVRTLESAPIKNGEVQPFSKEVDLYIRPGHKFRVVDHLITNFHLPKSSLLILVSAFAGRETILNAYEQAIAARMRFYSYGDAMVIL